MADRDGSVGEDFFEVTNDQHAAAEQQAAALIDLFDFCVEVMRKHGLTKMQATSAMTTRMMERMWEKASAAARAQGRDPVPARFIGCASDATRRRIVMEFRINVEAP